MPGRTASPDRPEDRESAEAQPSALDGSLTVTCRMPAEWERQQAVWISFPHNPDTWPSNLADAQAEMSYLVHFLSESEPVRINVPAGYERRLEREFAAEVADERVILHDVPTNDAWCRDHGAIFVHTSSPGETPSGIAAVSWGYNAWGGKYPPFDLDNDAACRMADALGVHCLSGGMILEGGAVDVNGAGLLLTTESCLLNPTRNPTLSRREIEDALRCGLGAEEILWLAGGDVAGDDTDGHIDNLARFVNETVVVHVVAPDNMDVNHGVLLEQTRQLEGISRDAGLELVELPMPDPVVFDGVRLPASYANFLITNEVVLLPSYGKRDDTARSILRELFPTRQVVLIPSSNLVVGLGSIHCLTQQVPCAPLD